MKKVFNFQFSIFNFSRGFSLIELLMVIAIIGIISSVVLTQLSRSRAKAYDSKVKQQLTSFRTAAEIYFQNNSNTYSPATLNCNDNSSIFKDLTPTNGQPGKFIDPTNLPLNTQIVCNSTASEYAVKATLYSGNEYWCVDNKGFSGLVSGVPVLSSSCP